MSEYAGVLMVLSVLAIVVAIVWIFLPFAIVGTKPLLRHSIAQQAEILSLLRSIVPNDETHDRCIACREYVWPDARICPYCRIALSPRAPTPPEPERKGLARLLPRRQ